MAVLDDPLLAQMAAASPLTPPAEDTLFQPLDVSLKLPDSPMAEQFADEYMESVAEEPEVDVESAHLVTHAKVYAIAEKYVCPSVISAPGFLLFFLFDRALATSLCCRVTSGKSPRSLRGASPASSKGQSRPPHHNPAHGVLQRHCPITNPLILSILICRLVLLDQSVSLCHLPFITCGTYAEDHVLTYITDTVLQV
jgi:hypothetical protein